MDLEQKAIERIRLASDLSLKHYGKPLVCEYSGGKDSDVLLQLFRMAEIPFEVHNSHTTVDAPQTVRHPTPEELQENQQRKIYPDEPKGFLWIPA